MKKIGTLLCVMTLMLASFTAGVQYERGDVDHDGRVSIDDVTCLINYLLTRTWPDEPVTPSNHEYVDLGLPSGTLWATCNVGATSPEEYGDYCAWGETAPKEVYSLSNYKWYREGEYDATYDYWHLSGWTKYCKDRYDGYDYFVDNRIELELVDDAAYVNWGPSWRMPSIGEQDELITSCTWQWIAMNDVLGYQGTGPNGNSIFFPASGQRWDSSLIAQGTWGGCWSRGLSLRSLSSCAYGAYFDVNNGVGFYDLSRYGGFPVRPVRVQ